MNKGMNKDPQDSNSISFGSFVMSLCTQALMQMGEIPAPEGIAMEKDLEAARQTIDIISMLKDKTKGNLDATEQNLLEDMLHQLRISYVAKRS